MITTLSPQSIFDTVDPGITKEWIQSLSPELKDAALYRLCKTVEAKPTLVESFTLNQVLYRTISGNSFTESAEHVAARTGCDRKTILKGLNQAVEQNILEKNERPGTSTEYSFKPVEEWLPEPVVRKTDIRTRKVVEFPKVQDTEKVETEPQLASNDGVVHDTDYEDFSSNTDHQAIRVVHETDTPTIWRSNPDGRRFCQIPPIHDQEIGVEIQRQMEQEGLTAQSVVRRAIAFSKVPLMLLEMLANIGRKLLEGFSSVEPESSKRVENKVSNPVTAAITPITKTFDTSVELEDIEIDELSDVMTQIKLQLHIPIEAGFKDSIKRNWKGDTHFNNALAWCVETAEWLESQNKLDRERVFGMLINAMKNDKKPNNRPSSPEKLENASAYAPKQPGQQPTQQQLQKLCEAKEKGLIRDLFDSAGDGVLKVIDRLGFAMPWYEWLGLQPN
ncbi:hypothetical protein G7B40_037665 [Aetokthonos hydrillicola Thurmond2011]|jgi:hypothetical protein|uniref:Uncharacterized protein n=1 Tax=Aetokthonos hydrillicola Thurmond2011 TaxID=2712845 RepID=A0AAP5IFD7_9CYAN|nr:hypothetical protein [Aetokthonos hydrillicola]MBO3461202.1 hypothetical protein [Aetokthonos hydrillicola CCALA 1050]MBW4589744.1 hypothetical protein [Aetokthonos hydrillicola CCALA 1050]MDR9900239.1 hypothetical protein [Aetokthonos hydrillicola Thurmond2011]